MAPDLPNQDGVDMAVKPRPSRRRQRGQGLVMFVGAIVFLIGLLAIVVDVTWYWANSLQVQRAADAAALAGAVWLPDQPARATTEALKSATQNGYTTGSGVTVTAVQNPVRDIQLDTSVSAPVSTFFMRLFGINSIQATRKAAAEYVVPVPMGSPLNYFGAFGDLRGMIHMDPGFRSATATKSTVNWSNPSGAFTKGDGQYATVSTTTAQQFGTFNIPLYGTSQQFLDDGGIEVTVTGHASAAACAIRVDVSPDNGVNWYGGSAPNAPPFANGEGTTPGPSQTLPAGSTDADLTFGGELATSATDTGDWFGRSNWNSGQFSNTNFRVRITPVGSSCTDSIDGVQVKVVYDAQTPRVVGPNGESLVQQGVWATALSQGADIINGDIYSPDSNGSGANTEYRSPPNTAYYDYAVEMEPGTTNGSVYIYDPVFCATNNDGSQGMGDRGFQSGGTWGSGGISTFYDLWDTNNTPLDVTDDTWIAGNTGQTGSLSPTTSNPLYNLFKDSNRTDPSQGGPSVSGSRTSCELGTTVDPTNGAYWHNRWWQIASAVAGPPDSIPKVYRIRVTTTDPLFPGDQGSVNGQNSFSIFANVAGHTCPSTPADLACPRVYGLGTMEAFTPLEPNNAADLYLSQIKAAYAGKTLKISLWDPGDTGDLRADLSFLMPTATGYTPANFTWTASRFSTSGSASNCNGSQTTPVSSVRTNDGGSSTNSNFNGCWLIINIPVPTTYNAPTPPGEPGPGWWKIRYAMGNQSSVSGFDLTTWKTQLIGNPVHLVVP